MPDERTWEHWYNSSNYFAPSFGPAWCGCATAPGARRRSATLAAARLPSRRHWLTEDERTTVLR